VKIGIDKPNRALFKEIKTWGGPRYIFSGGHDTSNPLWSPALHSIVHSCSL